MHGPNSQPCYLYLLQLHTLVQNTNPALAIKARQLFMYCEKVSNTALYHLCAVMSVLKTDSLIWAVMRWWLHFACIHNTLFAVLQVNNPSFNVASLEPSQVTLAKGTSNHLLRFCHQSTWQFCFLLHTLNFMSFLQQRGFLVWKQCYVLVFVSDFFEDFVGVHPKIEAAK